MRTKLSYSAATICTMVFGLGCRQESSHGLKVDPRWSVPPELVSGSYRQLTNDFATENAAFRITMELTSNTNFAVFCRYAHSGIRSFEGYCYERVADDMWHLRCIQFFNISDSMKVEALATNGAVDFVHDGVKLFSVFGASNQVRIQSQARSARGQLSP